MGAVQTYLSCSKQTKMIFTLDFQPGLEPAAIRLKVKTAELPPPCSSTGTSGSHRWGIEYKEVGVNYQVKLLQEAFGGSTRLPLSDAELQIIKPLLLPPHLIQSEFGSAEEARRGQAIQKTSAMRPGR